MARYLYRRPFDRRLAPWQPTLLGRPPLPPPDDKTEGRVDSYLPLSLHAPRRAGISGYAVFNPIPPAESLPPGQAARLFQPIARPALTARSAYWNGEGVPPGEASVEGRVDVFLPSQLFVRARAATSAYGRINHVPPDPNDPPALPPAIAVFPATALGRAWASFAAYRIGGGTAGLFAFGARLPGCPYRGEREGQQTGSPSRPAESEGLPGRAAADGVTAPARPASAVSYPTRQSPVETPPIRPGKCC